VPEPDAGPEPARSAASPVNVIAEDTRIGGPIATCRDLLVAGAVAGDVSCGGAVVLERGGEIRGNVDADDNVVVSGLVVGNVTTGGRLTISETGRVQGDVTAKALALAEGGELRGRCMTGVPRARPAVADEVDLTNRMFAAPSLAALPA
jgi:cytoskeletal protein CcmA (bactofilin family)